MEVLSRPHTSNAHERAHALIPGGAHTYAKGDDQFPANAPPFIARGKGAVVWDDDGRSYIEYGMGLRSVTLGHAYDRVIDAARRTLEGGVNFPRPHMLEVELAEALAEMIPGAEMVKFTKDGSTATSAAIRLARAITGRDQVAMCVDHPFFSYDDWFIGSSDMNAGIPEAVRSLSHGFSYGDPASLEQLFLTYPNQIACVIMEPAKYEEPPEGYLPEVQRLCHENGALFILDEMITGFRWHNHGAGWLYGVEPDLATFGKGMANGFSVSALVGKREYMERGGLNHTHERVFILSTTHGAETHGLAAALETVRVYQEEDVVGHLHRIGAQLALGANDLAAEFGISDYWNVIGRPCNLVFQTRDSSGNPSQFFRALFMQEMIRNGVIAPSFVVSYSHTKDVIDRTLEAVWKSLTVYAKALENGSTDGLLEGHPTKPVFRRYS